MKKFLSISIVFFLSISSATGKPLRCSSSNDSCSACGLDEDSMKDSVTLGKKECILIPSAISSITPDAFNNKPLKRLVFSPEWGKPCELHTIDVQPESFRSLPVLESLKLRCVKLQGTSKPFQFLKTLTELQLDSNGLTGLPGELFAGASNLTTLYVTGQDFTALSPDSFTTINQGLETLVLRQNKLISIEPRSFMRLHHLKRLTIDQSPLSNLSLHTFEGLGQLETLELVKNRITELRRETFQGLLHLKKLVLMKNQISEIESGSFAGLNNLKILILEGNNLSYVRSDMFAELGQLEELGLDGNGITRFSGNSFNGLQQLKVLGLYDNEIREIDSASFSGLTNLERLHLEGNHLEDLPDGCFRDMKKLKTLDLRKNPIRNIRDNSFQGLGNLSWLSFSFDENLQIGLNALSKLHLDKLFLDIDHCSALKADALNGLSTRNLYFYCNNTEEIKPYVFRGLRVEEISICWSNIRTIDKQRWDLDDSVKILFPSYYCDYY